MYIVIIGWMYVVVLMAATENNLAAGLATLLFYGFLPCAILWYLFMRKRPITFAKTRSTSNKHEP